MVLDAQSTRKVISGRHQRYPKQNKTKQNKTSKNQNQYLYHIRLKSHIKTQSLIYINQIVKNPPKNVYILYIYKLVFTKGRQLSQKQWKLGLTKQHQRQQVGRRLLEDVHPGRSILQPALNILELFEIETTRTESHKTLTLQADVD